MYRGNSGRHRATHGSRPAMSRIRAPETVGHEPFLYVLLGSNLTIVDGLILLSRESSRLPRQISTVSSGQLGSFSPIRYIGFLPFWVFTQITLPVLSSTQPRSVRFIASVKAIKITILNDGCIPMKAKFTCCPRLTEGTVRQQIQQGATCLVTGRNENLILDDDR